MLRENRVSCNFHDLSFQLFIFRWQRRVDTVKSADCAHFLRNKTDVLSCGRTSSVALKICVEGWCGVCGTGGAEWWQDSKFVSQAKKRVSNRDVERAWPASLQLLTRFPWIIRLCKHRFVISSHLRFFNPFRNFLENTSLCWKSLLTPDSDDFEEMISQRQEFDVLQSNKTCVLDKKTGKGKKPKRWRYRRSPQVTRSCQDKLKNLLWEKPASWNSCRSHQFSSAQKTFLAS